MLPVSIGNGGIANASMYRVVSVTEEVTGIITKIDEDKRLVFGWASIIKDTEGKVLLDRQDDFIDDESELEKSAYQYVLTSRDGGEMHIRKGVSTMVESVVLTKEKQEALGIPEGTVPVGWWIGFRVNDERVWDEVKKGGYSGFSVHGTGQRSKATLEVGKYTDVEKRDFSTKQREAMAEEGAAMPDGSFPIANEEDLKNALQSIGRAKDREATLKHIRSRAKELGVEDMLPDWAVSKGVKVSKRTLALLTKAQKSKIAAMQEDDMGEDMNDGMCPHCGMPVSKEHDQEGGPGGKKKMNMNHPVARPRRGSSYNPKNDTSLGGRRHSGSYQQTARKQRMGKMEDGMCPDCGLPMAKGGKGGKGMCKCGSMKKGK